MASSTGVAPHNTKLRNGSPKLLAPIGTHHLAPTWQHTNTSFYLNAKSLMTTIKIFM